ncbi:MAG: nitroreductase [Candidatus Bipolaricaulota bacterium]|nr:nitroreductase [Candidatus Bipolaricaulota bacterium]
MNTREAIAARRSIRKFKPDSLPREALDAIVSAAMQAPSAKNRQPWRFTVVAGGRRADMIQAFREGLDHREKVGEGVGSARWTLACMEQAPVTVFVHNPDGRHPWLAREENASWGELADVQSIGAAIQNMLLAAQDLGIGSLWIADVWDAYTQLNAWLGTDEQMVAAVSFGYADEAPPARPRKSRSEVVREI